MPELKQGELKPDQGPKPARFGTRLALLAGFGGLLALMAAAGLDSIRVLREIQTRSAQVHGDFVSRERSLEQVRAALYLSGTTVRDYLLLDPGPGAAEMLRSDLKNIRDEMDAALAAYSRSLRPEEREPFRSLNAELETYWQVLNPVFEWDAADKRERSYWFLRREVFPRRAVVLNIASGIGAMNEQALREGEKRVAEIFDRFRGRLKIMSAIALGLGLVVAALSIRYILRLEKNAGLRYRESVRIQAELKELSARLVDAQERERRAISRELHDAVGQSLTALLMDVGNLAATAPPADAAFHQRLASIKRLAETSVNAVRHMALLLRPSMLDDLGLVPALQWQAREVSKRAGIRVDLLEENVSDELPEEHKTCVFRLVQEALHNCARHAEASSARIIVRQEAGRLLLTVQDDGKGFDAGKVRGLGLVGMAERVAHLGGMFHVESTPGRGTLLRIELPLAAPALQADPVLS